MNRVIAEMLDKYHPNGTEFAFPKNSVPHEGW